MIGNPFSRTHGGGASQHYALNGGFLRVSHEAGREKHSENKWVR